MPHLRFLAVAAALAMASAACGATDTSPERPRATPEPPATARPEPAGTITVYARDRQIAEPLFEQFEEKTGIAVQARWGNPIDLAQQIIDDGAASPADVYYGPFSDALGALSAAGRLAPLSAAELDRVPTEYRSPDGTWVGTSGRAHVVFYNTDKLRPDDLPDSILGFADPAWRGRIGWDPTSRSLQDVVAELEQLEGADAARNWLEGVVANAPASIQGAPAVVKAVAAGELVEVGFGSHSYLNLVQADGEAPNVAARFYLGSEPGGILNVAGVGIVDTTDKPAEAKALVDFMLSNQAQLLLAESAYEIPVIPGVQPPPGMPTAEQLEVRGLDIRKFEQLTDARRLLIETGVIGLPESSLRSYGDSVPEEHGNPDTEVRRLMDDEFDWERRDHLVARLDRMVESGRMTESEANRLRSASDAETFNSAARDIRLRHARDEIDRGVEAGNLTKAEADAILARIAQSDHDRSLRSQIGRLTRDVSGRHGPGRHRARQEDEREQ